jgi:two-component system LytT family sensor kinase
MQQTIFIQLLIKIGLVASLTALLARSSTFKKILFVEKREFRQKLLFSFFWGGPLFLGFLFRTQFDYYALDLSLEGIFLAGLLAGNVTGALLGSLLGLAAAVHQEWLTLPLAPIVGMMGGLLRSLCPNKEEIWKLSPFIPFSTLLSFRSKEKFLKSGWQISFTVVWLGIDLFRYLAGPYVNSLNDRVWIYYLHPESGLDFASILIADIVCVGLAIKIWNNTRIEIKLVDQEVLVMKSRLDALANQINPHFLFNTLNSISALIRTNPESARNMILKLSNILRKLLKGHENFITLREELEFIDNYLDIEVIRFGKDKLRVEKEIEPAALETVVPGMILQPIIENSLKHGISPKIEGGSIRIRAFLRKNRLHIDVNDDGVGIRSDQLAEIYRSGIGISNIVERLKVAYQTDFVFQVNSNIGYGTFTHIEIPLVSAPSPEPASARS